MNFNMYATQIEVIVLKKVLTIVIFCFIVTMSCGCENSSDIDLEYSNEIIGNDTLIINGEFVTNTNVRVFSNIYSSLNGTKEEKCALIPLFTILREIGCTTEQKQEHIVLVHYKERTYTVDLHLGIMYEPNNSQCLFSALGGAPNFYYLKENDLVIGDCGLMCILRYMKVTASIEIDLENDIIRIDVGEK